MSAEVIETLARKCARANLDLRDARALFHSLYISDAIMLAGGNKSKAAEIAEVERRWVSRTAKKALLDGEAEE